MPGMIDRTYFEKIIRVHCSKCKQWLDERTVEVFDIAEDIHGYDILTFTCPVCKLFRKSKRFG